MRKKNFVINEHPPPKKIFENFLTGEEIKQNLQDAKDGIIVFDEAGRIVMINEPARLYFQYPNEEIIGKVIGNLLYLKTFAHKRLLCEAKKCFKLAVKGIPQQFHWVQETNKRPTQAFNVILNVAILDNSKVIIARFVDIIQAKILEWVLWSLAGIANRGGITDVIDEITKLASLVFNAEHAIVNLFNSKDTTHTVSYFYLGKKQNNFSYSILNAPCEDVKNDKVILHFNGDVQAKYPNHELLRSLDINSYLGGPLITSEDEVVGLLNVLSKKNIEVTALNKTLFRLFIDRISLEIERLLTHKKLQFLASFPQQDPNPVMRIQADSTILYANKSGRAILDYWAMRKPEIPDKLMDACQRAQKSGEVIREEFEVNNHIYLFTFVWIESFSQINIYATEITELKSVQQKMRDLANYDVLTNIANRQFFNQTLSTWIDSAKNNNTLLGLLLIDLDNFKSVNDTMGHSVGDRLLKTLTRRISGCLRRTDFIARLGGDEFVVLLKIHNTSDIEMIAEKITRALSTPFELGEYHIETSCSIGVSFYPQNGLTPGELLKKADIAMYQAKKNGRNQYILFSDTKHHGQSKRRTVIKRDLKNPSLASQLYIDYQPEFDLNSAQIIGFEAFVRWRHPKQGLISPNEFLPLAEQTGSIYSIGYWVIKQALHDYQTTMSPITNAKLSLNIAQSQLNDQHFVDNLCEDLDRNNMDTDLVILDIAEQISIIQNRHLDEHLQAIRAHGIQLSLDNYGSSHSSLSRLLEVPINIVKLDQNFLHTLHANPRNKAFISGIISLANKMGLQVIQKGVENKEQSELLIDLGCHYAQGYYYCPPLPIHTLELFLTKYGKLS